MFMAAHFFLWVYPKNAGLMSTRFRMCVKYCQGKYLWDWIRKIQDLTQEQMKWDESLGSNDKSAFVASIDCTDCKIWEPRAHHKYNVDKLFFSKKLAGSGLKYEIVLDLVESKVLSIVGPVKASEHDMNVFRQEMKEKALENGA